MKPFNFRIGRDNEEKDINNLIMKLGLYSDDVNIDYEQDEYIGVEMQISDEIDEGALHNLVNPFRYRK